MSGAPAWRKAEVTGASSTTSIGWMGCYSRDPYVPQGRPHLDRGFPLQAGKRRGEPHGARVCLPRNRDPADRSRGSQEEAYALTSIGGDRRVTQLVDIRKGVHCMIP